LPFAEGGLTVTEQPDDFNHQRRHERIDSVIPVRISTIEPERDPKTGRPFFRTLQETCANVSRGGIFIKTNEPLDAGRRLLVEIRLPSGRPLEAIGRIAWVKRVLSPERSESGIGIEFLGGASEQLQALDEYVSHRCEPAEPSRD
jgi:type IV pilus assembly protein PilZ